MALRDDCFSRILKARFFLKEVSDAHCCESLPIVGLDYDFSREKDAVLSFSGRGFLLQLANKVITKNDLLIATVPHRQSRWKLSFHVGYVGSPMVKSRTVGSLFVTNFILFLQRPWCLPLVQHTAHGGDGGAPDGSRLSSPAGAPVGAIGAKAAALLHAA